MTGVMHAPALQSIQSAAATVGIAADATVRSVAHTHIVVLDFSVELVSMAYLLRECPQSPYTMRAKSLQHGTPKIFAFFTV